MLLITNCYPGAIVLHSQAHLEPLIEEPLDLVREALLLRQCARSALSKLVRAYTHMSWLLVIYTAPIHSHFMLATHTVRNALRFVLVGSAYTQPAVVSMCAGVRCVGCAVISMCAGVRCANVACCGGLL